MTCSRTTSALMAGAAAGLAGTAAMIAFRLFDETYAPRTIPKMRKDPGEFMVERAEEVAHLSRVLPNGAAQDPGRSRGDVDADWLRHHSGNCLCTAARPAAKRLVAHRGATIGIAVYLLGYIGWLPRIGLTRPPWKQPLPEVVGETMRHMAYGITTAAAYSALNAVASGDGVRSFETVLP